MGATRTNRLPPRKGARHLVALLHGWIGVFASLFIFLIAATGLMPNATEMNIGSAPLYM